MPYKIRKLPLQNKFKVYTATGRPLSKAGLSKKQAQKQLVAVSISEGIFRSKK